MGVRCEAGFRCLAVTAQVYRQIREWGRRFRSDRQRVRRVALDQDYRAYRWYGGQPREIPELRLSFPLELRVSVAGLFLPEFSGKISATCGRRDSRAGLHRDAR